MNEKKIIIIDLTRKVFFNVIHTIVAIEVAVSYLKLAYRNGKLNEENKELKEEIKKLKEKEAKNEETEE